MGPLQVLCAAFGISTKPFDGFLTPVLGASFLIFGLHIDPIASIIGSLWIYRLFTYRR